jgi:hypothetical protein
LNAPQIRRRVRILPVPPNCHSNSPSLESFHPPAPAPFKLVPPMLMPHESAVVNAMGFTPLDLVDVHVGLRTVKLYPKIGPAMQIREHVHAYQINKTTLTNLLTNSKLITDAFGAQLNASLTTEGIISDFKRYFYDCWMCFQNLTILSFHDSAGAIINDTTSPADPQVLLPVQDGNLVNCCSQGVRFVRVQCVLDLCSLVTATPYPISTTLRLRVQEPVQ